MQFRFNQSKIKSMRIIYALKLNFVDSHLALKLGSMQHILPKSFVYVDEEQDRATGIVSMLRKIVWSDMTLPFDLKILFNVTLPILRVKALYG